MPIQSERKGTNLKSGVLLSVIIIIFFTSAAQAVGENYFLEFKELSGQAVLRLPLQSDETFTIRYIHSVDKTPVFEIFETDHKGRLTLQATYFKMFGAGMGHWQGRGFIDFDGKWTWIKNIHEPLGSFILRVGSLPVNHTLLYRKQEISLSKKWAGKRLQVTVTGNSNK